VATVPPHHLAQHTTALTDAVERIELVPTPPPNATILAKARGRLQRPGTKTLEQRIVAMHQQEPFDVVLSARLALPFQMMMPGVPVVADLCDAVPNRPLARIRASSPVDALVAVVIHRDALHSEDRMIREADHVILASVRDRAQLASRGGPLPPISIVPNGVDGDRWSRRRPLLGRDVVMFGGAMPYAPNEDAAMFLLDEIMPIVWGSRPATRLLIVGRDPQPRLIAAVRGRPNVELTGFVEDMRDHLERASVVAATLRIGTGIQNKILEAMAMGVPVVTTPVGEAGLRVPGDLPPPLSVAADAAGLADLILAHLEAVDRDPSPDTRGREWVRQHFRWDDMVERMDRVLRLAVAEGRRAGGGVRQA
jgi:glycosyltransferase involved in cell wall biosynthesis